MMRWLIIPLILCVAAATSAADPLTTPITQTITQFRLDAVNIDVQNKTVTFQVSLLDGSGGVVRIHTMTATTADLAIGQPQLDGLAARIVAFLKARGTLN